MATQQAGLFTQGPSVEDLLQKRNTQAANLQQQLMAQAAQGSRTPAKARAFSLLGSSLGRALSGAVGGGQDQQLAEIKAKQAAQKGLQEQALTIGVNGTSAQQAQLSRDLHQAGYMKAAVDMANKSKATRDIEADTDKAKADEVLAAEQLRITTANNKRLADSVRADLPVVAENAANGDPAAIAIAYKYRADKKANVSDSDEEDKGTAAEQNYSAYAAEVSKLDAFLANGTMGQEEYNAKVKLAQKGLLDYTDKYQEEMGKQQAKEISALRTENNKEIGTIFDTKATIQQSLDILDTDIYTGAGGEGFLAIKKLLHAVGAPVDITNMADSEQFRSNAMTFVLQYVSQTKGSISDAEMKAFTKAAAGLGNTVEGNRLILNTALKAAAFREGRAVYMDRWFDEHVADGKYPRPSEYNNAQRKWEQENQVDYPTSAEIQAIKDGTAVVIGNEVTLPSTDLQKLNDQYGSQYGAN